MGRRKLLSNFKAANIEFNDAYSAQDRYGASVFVTPAGMAKYAAATAKASAALELARAALLADDARKGRGQS